MSSILADLDDQAAPPPPKRVAAERNPKPTISATRTSFPSSASPSASSPVRAPAPAAPKIEKEKSVTFQMPEKEEPSQIDLVTPKREVKEPTLDDMQVDLQQRQVENLSVQEPQTMKYKEERPDLQDWKKVDEALYDLPSNGTGTHDGKVEAKILEPDNSLHMWWYDAYERRENGMIYLFGKVSLKADGVRLLA